MSEYLEEDLTQTDDPEIVHWMNPKPLTFGPGAASAGVVGAFALGVVATLSALAIARWLETDR